VTEDLSLLIKISEKVVMPSQRDLIVLYQYLKKKHYNIIRRNTLISILLLSVL